MKKKYLQQTTIKINHLTMSDFKDLNIKDTSMIDELTNEINKLIIDDTKEDLTLKTSENIETKKSSENIETEKSIEAVIVNKKKKKERKIVYYAVHIENELFEKFEDVLKENDKLIKLEKIHSTLIFFKNHDPSLYEECKIYYSKFENMQVNIDIVGYGISENAFALDVSSIKCEDEEIKSYAVKQHITMALNKEIKAFESVKTFLGEGTVVKLDEPLKITGFIKPYYW